MEYAPSYDGKDGQDLIVVVSMCIFGVFCGTEQADDVQGG